jgi:hypothetical protein
MSERSLFATHCLGWSAAFGLEGWQSRFPFLYFELMSGSNFMEVDMKRLFVLGLLFLLAGCAVRVGFDDGYRHPHCNYDRCW